MVGWLDQVRMKQTWFLGWSNWGKDRVENFFGPTHITYKLSFWKYIPIFVYILAPFWASYNIFGNL